MHKCDCITCRFITHSTTHSVLLMIVLVHNVHVANCYNTDWSLIRRQHTEFLDCALELVWCVCVHVRFDIDEQSCNLLRIAVFSCCSSHPPTLISTHRNASSVVYSLDIDTAAMRAQEAKFPDGRVRTIHTDVSSKKDCEAAVSRVLKEQGRSVVQ